MALIHWLVSQKERAPREAPTRAPERSAVEGKAHDRVPSAKVTTTIPHGSLVLAGPRGLVRLSWNQGQRAHYLPAGVYRIRNLRVIGKHEGQVWFTSATQAKGKPLRIEGGSPLKLRLGNAVKFDARVRWKKNGELGLGFALRDTQGRGLSIFRKGSRVTVHYELLSAKGRLLHRGKMNYG